jgi:hypothetical protein
VSCRIGTSWCTGVAFTCFSHISNRPQKNDPGHKLTQGLVQDTSDDWILIVSNSEPIAPIGLVTNPVRNLVSHSRRSPIPYGNKSGVISAL